MTNRQIPHSHFNPSMVQPPSYSQSHPAHIYRSVPVNNNPSIGLSEETEPVDNIMSPLIEYIVYYESGNADSERVVDFVKNKSGGLINSRIVCHDVNWIRRNQSKYPWFSLRGIRGVPSIYERKTGKVYGDGSRENTAISFLEKLAKETLDHQRTSTSRISPHSLSSSSSPSVTIETILTKLDEIKEQLTRKNIEDSSFQAKVLSFISKSINSTNPGSIGLRTPALNNSSSSSGANLPHEIPLASPKVSAFRSGSPPSTEDGKQRVKFERRPNKLMDPIHGFTKLGSESSTSDKQSRPPLSEEEKRRREMEMERQELERQQNIEDLERFFSKDGKNNEDTKTVFVDEPTVPIPSSPPSSSSSRFSRKESKVGSPPHKPMIARDRGQLRF